jgi:hypothetical protein
MIPSRLIRLFPSQIVDAIPILRIRNMILSRKTTICLHYNSMLHLDFLGPNQMIVVEQPWLRVISTFPEALQRRVYGFN